MSAATLSIYEIGFPNQSGKGFAEEAEYLENRYKEILEEFKSSESTGRYSEVQTLINEVEEVFKSCSKDDWDGYGANAVSGNTYWGAIRVIEMLSAAFLKFPMPEITPEPEGDIAFEWNDEYGRTFVFSIDDDQVLTYAGIFGSSRVHGDEILGDFLPGTIIYHLKRLFPK